MTPRHEKRHAVAARTGWNCNYCNRRTECAVCNPDTDRIATIDHVIPLSRGGADSLWNLVIACQPCNQRKADEMLAGVPPAAPPAEPEPEPDQGRYAYLSQEAAQQACHAADAGSVAYRCRDGCHYWHIGAAQDVLDFGGVA